jgi:bifunctional DNA-binding transcriptional regulator/antitoxin component of YhaV-PrlF toxin-antitoxin module
MPLIKLKDKFQFTLPVELREELELEVGDLFEAQIEDGKIMLTPKSVVDKQLAKGLKDIQKGRVHGPFRSADELRTSLRGKTSKKKKKGAPR